MLPPVISHLKNIDWLTAMRIFYWGDLDVHGFHILHQMRSYYPQTKSILMDRQTFDAFSFGIVPGERSYNKNASSLTSEEREMFEFLRSGNLRLEQEKIGQAYADKVIREMVG